ncbi:MAG: transcriptional regulator NrdR [Candidatus Kerfeldbacteria bacterium RIFCSPHIGHO2_12_FULL_48_17]|uniref:Transcriptional repressor NrdR n=1 Tax=Candidatus Kerfeldbacteria bacterium RIFCSPHIGHO2_12_FULL_48_17 TaxID=1798542 RepID=A0A1G2B3X5_9BACT|nr:MAG: transcriptional regulator NrdR [Candidatus Kerfeldbacteria bacterium RIFCSPHIGHO2_12_FULL_48_17]
MLCPLCNHQETRVLDSRDVDDGLAIRRRRECTSCNFRFSTMEGVEILNLRVVKSDGTDESYQKEKLIGGLKKAFEKRPIDGDRFRSVANRIERDIQLKSKHDRIASEEIGRIVVKHLKRVDKIAYLRFASVYYAYQDLEEFRLALLDLKPRAKKPVQHNNKKKALTK